MGSLKPGVQYVYEKTDGVVYARQMGDPPDKRFEIGSDYTAKNGPKICGMPIEEVSMLVDMVKQSEHHPALQEALERAKLIYRLCQAEDE